MDRDLDMAMKIVEEIKTLGGQAYFVGGYVRDMIMGIDNKDIDIEIHGITPEQLLDILTHFGEPIETGADFGVYGLKEYDLDLALPRRERAVGKGHKDFVVDVDPFLGTKEAAQRRDFTINAMMKNVLTGEIVDHFQGLEDLKDGCIRHVNEEAFAEDPLRLFRGAQFASRFQFRVADETLALCRTMDVSTLAKERVYGEMKKALLKADKPSIFFETLKEMEQLSTWFPEVEQLIGIQQNEKYHQEGDVWNHTMLVLDEAAKCRHKVEDPLSYMMAALCHDFGKYVVTEEIDGVYHAYNHEIEGLGLVESFLNRISGEKHLLDYVLNMVELHMKPGPMAVAASPIKKTNKLFDSALSPYDLIQLCQADQAGSLVCKTTQLESGDIAWESEQFLLDRLSIYKEYMARPYVMGRDLIKAGLKPGEDFSVILAHAHKLRLAGIEKDNALKQTLAYAAKLRKKN